MKNRALPCIIVACLLSACGGQVELRGDDAGVSGREGIPDAGPATTSTTIATEAAAPPDAAGQVTGVGGGCGDSAPSGLGIDVNPTVKRFYSDGVTPYPFRSQDQDPSAVDAQDCEDDIILQFSVSLCGLPTTDTIQVWAGTTDCTQASARELGAGPYCWQVAPSGAFANSTISMGNIYVRNITRWLGISDAGRSELGAVTSVPGVNACQSLASPTSACSVPLSLYFVFISPDGVTADGYARYELGAFVGPTEAGSCSAHGG
jgi:hypothetical protein